MSTSSDFLKAMDEAGRKYDGGGSSLGVVGRMLIEFGFHCYIPGLDFWASWRVAKTPDDMHAANESCQAKITEHNASGSPRFGIKVTCFADALTAKDGPYKRDLMEFTPQWQEDAYKMIMESVDGLPVNETFFGQAQYKANPFNVAKGEEGKTDKDQNGNPRFPTIRVPVKKFKDEAEARAFVGSNSSASIRSNSQWSEKAIAEYGPDMSSFELNAEEILDVFSKAKSGIGMDGFPIDKYKSSNGVVTPPKAKVYTAEIYGIETSDVDVALSLTVAF